MQPKSLSAAASVYQVSSAFRPAESIRGPKIDLEQTATVASWPDITGNLMHFNFNDALENLCKLKKRCHKNKKEPLYMSRLVTPVLLLKQV